MSTKKVAIIGAGPAGLTAAYALTKKGFAVEVFEAGDAVGGLAKSFDLWNQRVDLGPHRFFSSDRRVNELWLEVVGNEYAMVDRQTRIYYKKRFFHYPLKPINALKNLGVFEAFRCFFSYLKEKIKPTKLDGSFENWVISRFGKRLFEIFFKTYSEKLWGIPCKELDADFAAQRIKKLSLFSAIWNALISGRGNKHKTLVDQFAYPTKGSGIVYQKMQAYIEANGGTVHLNQPVKRIFKNDHGLSIQIHDQKLNFDEVISSMPITLLLKGLPDAPPAVQEFADRLKFRNTILIYLEIDSQDIFTDQWLYVHSPDLSLGRVTNFRNWTKELVGDAKSSILCLELWCNDEDALWNDSDDSIAELGRKEIQMTGLVTENQITNTHIHRIKRCYPVYQKGYRDNLGPVEDYLDQIDHLHVIGRYGAFKYNNQDHSIIMGLLAAENIADGTDHDLWNINTDYDTYQESSVITATGLEKN